MAVAPGDSIVWRLSLHRSPEEVFELLDTDEGRERFWANSSRSTPSGFELTFPGGLEEHVEVLERKPPTRMAIRYFGSRAEFDLARRDEGGCLFEVRCKCDDEAAWTDFYAGWVSWLLVFKAAADFDVDLRNGADDRTWAQRYVDQ